MSRTQYPAGPAYLTAGGITIEMSEDWKAESQIMVEPIKTNLHGTVGQSLKYTLTKITGKPVATTANLAALMAYLFPWSSDQIGQLIFPSAEAPAVIQTVDGYSITYAASAITKMPDITFAANTDIFGEFELTCLNAFEAAPTSAANVVAVASSAFTAPSATPLLRLRSPYTVAWGSTSPFSAIEVDKSGVKFTPELKLENVESDLYQLVNMRITDVGAQAKFTPLNFTAANLYAFVQLVNSSGYSNVGSIMGNLGQIFTVTGPTGFPILTMPLAVPTQGPLQFSGSKSRVGEVTLVGNRASSSGVLGNTFGLSVH